MYSQDLRALKDVATKFITDKGASSLFGEPYKSFLKYNPGKVLKMALVRTEDNVVFKGCTVSMSKLDFSFDGSTDKDPLVVALITRIHVPKPVLDNIASISELAKLLDEVSHEVTDEMITEFGGFTDVEHLAVSREVSFKEDITHLSIFYKRF